MAKKRKISKLVKVSDKKKSGSKIMKALEAVVVIGAFAAFLMKFLKGKKAK